MSELKKIKQNTFWLVIFQLAKMIFPFLTLPILTRRLAIDTYGDLTFVKTVMNFMQIFIDFGFMLSATKEIAKVSKDPSKINQILADTLLARLLLGFFGLIITLILSLIMPILNHNFLFTLFSFFAVFLSIFLFDFLFRGLEIIHIMTIRFVLMKTISILLTIIFVREDSQILLIPLFDVLSSVLAIFLVVFEVKKIQLKFIKPNLKSSLISLKNSFIYFLSDISATTFNAISTIIIGLVFSSTEVALFGLSIQIIGAIQALLGQLSGGIYPNMVRQKSLSFIKKVFQKTLPGVFLFTIAVTIFSPLALQILAGDKYLAAAPLIQILSVTILFSYCNVLLGWPTLGVINKQKSVTISTIISTIFNLSLLLILLVCQKLNLTVVAIIRVVTELILFAIRFYFFKKYRSDFKS